MLRYHGQTKRTKSNPTIQFIKTPRPTQALLEKQKGARLCRVCGELHSRPKLKLSPATRILPFTLARLGHLKSRIVHNFYHIECDVCGAIYYDAPVQRWNAHRVGRLFADMGDVRLPVPHRIKHGLRIAERPALTQKALRLANKRRAQLYKRRTKMQARRRGELEN